MTNDDNSDQPHFMVMHDPREAQQYQEMQLMEIKATVERFIDELNAEQCIALMRILQTIHFSPHYLHMIMGQLTALIRIVHKVCGSCGDTKHSTMEHISATGGGITPAMADMGFLVGLSKEEQMKKLNVRSDTAATLTSTGPIEVFVCRNCDTAYGSLLDRAQTGIICMICQQNKIALQDHPDSALDLGDLMTRYRVAESYTIEDGVVCLGCDTEFPSLRHRINEGKACPVCALVTEEDKDEGPSGTT